MTSSCLSQTNKLFCLGSRLSDKIASISIDGTLCSIETPKSETQRHNISDRLYNSTPCSKADFSKTEWLRVWCQTRFGYPQPEAGFEYKSITYIRERICPVCNSGLMQQDAFRIKKIPGWGRKHFAELNWVYDELFTSDIAKNVLQREQITGIEFETVKNRSGIDTVSGINQMRVTYFLQPGIIEEKTDIRKIAICEKCLKKKYLLYSDGRVTMHKEVFDGVPDVVKTAEIFGSGHCAVRYILMRKKVYEILVKNHLERGLVFEPIELI